MLIRGASRSARECQSSPAGAQKRAHENSQSEEIASRPKLEQPPVHQNAAALPKPQTPAASAKPPTSVAPADNRAPAIPLKSEQAVPANVVQDQCVLRDDDEEAEPSKREAEMAEKRGKCIAAMHEVTNLRWQSLHRAAGKKVVSGHWQKFLMHQGGIPCQDVRDCPECQSLLVPTEEAGEQDEQLPRYRSLAAPGAKRGRPKKGEDRSLDWKAWLQDERAGMYEIFTKDVQVKSRTKGVLEFKQGMTHLRCRICGGEFQLQRATNLVALHLHEASKRHQLALDPLNPEELQMVPVAELPTCQGVNLSEQAPPDAVCAKMKMGFLHWASLGCPDVVNKKASVDVRVTDDRCVVLQDSQCKKQGHVCAQGQPSCLKCARLPYTLSLAQSASKMLYRIHLVDLLTLAMRGKRADMRELWSSMLNAPWKAQVPYDMSTDLSDLTFGQLYRRCQQVIGGVDISVRNAAFHSWVQARFAWIVPGELPSEAHQASVEECAMSLVSKQERLNHRLSELVKSGVLDACSTSKVLVAALVQKADRMSRGLERVNRSTVDGVDECILHQAIFKLWRGMSRTEALKTFGLTKDTARAQQMVRLDFLPAFFCPPLDVLGKNCELALNHLSVIGTRQFMLAFDDTVFAKDFSLMHGIREKPVVIGGGLSGGLLHHARRERPVSRSQERGPSASLCFLSRKEIRPPDGNVGRSHVPKKTGADHRCDAAEDVRGNDSGTDPQQR